MTSLVTRAIPVINIHVSIRIVTFLTLAYTVANRKISTASSLASMLDFVLASLLDFLCYSALQCPALNTGQGKAFPTVAAVGESL